VTSPSIFRLRACSNTCLVRAIQIVSSFIYNCLNSRSYVERCSSSDITPLCIASDSWLNLQRAFHSATADSRTSFAYCSFSARSNSASRCYDSCILFNLSCSALRMSLLKHVLRDFTSFSGLATCLGFFFCPLAFLGVSFESSKVRDINCSRARAASFSRLAL